MKRKMIILIIFALIVAAAILYFLFGMKRNEVLELTIKTNGGVPYKWECKIEDESIVKLKKVYTVDQDKNVSGGVIYKNYVFKGLKKGKTKIIFNYVSIVSDNVVSKSVVNTVKVDSRHNVSLVVADDLNFK